MKMRAVYLILSVCGLWWEGSWAQAVAPMNAQEEVHRVTVIKPTFASNDVDIPIHVFKPTATNQAAGRALTAQCRHPLLGSSDQRLAPQARVLSEVEGTAFSIL